MQAESGTALVLGASPFGEADVLVHLLCPERGRLRGLVRRGTKKAAVLQPLNTVRFERFRRLESQLGTLEVELAISRAPLWMNGGIGGYICAYLAEMLTTLLPEEQPFPGMAERAVALLETATQKPEAWETVLAFELFLLETLGYGLRLTDPVQAHAEDILTYVSPRSGRSVGKEAGNGYEGRLLPLPACMGGPACPAEQNRIQAFALTGAFLVKALPHVPQTQQALLARARLAGYYAKSCNTSYQKETTHDASAFQAA